LNLAKFSKFFFFWFFKIWRPKKSQISPFKKTYCHLTIICQKETLSQIGGVFFCEFWDEFSHFFNLESLF